MKWSLPRILSSFRFKILFSFLAIAGTLLFWLLIYQWINFKESQLERFNTDLARVHSQSMESNRFLQYFIVKGYHEPAFYINGRQKDIDKFLSMQSDCIAKLTELSKRPHGKTVKLKTHLKRLIGVTAQLANAAKELKTIYFKKGFKDYGSEGVMRQYAHMLEDSAMVQRKDILMLRRHEKDFLIRGESSYADAFYEKAAQLLSSYHQGSLANTTLLRYIESFKEFETYSNQLGIYRTHGKYLEVQELPSSTYCY